ncbi:hypothetical protein NGI13_22270 [Enterobacter asburiae]|uniref:hypothetical protein n=1 Tax=Enterobacter asburiae TaxID=61645 RepID=UPI0012E11A79|nr:hypothetical protein [Enterobacter asburiae]MEB8258280.1 hypothetical protein [Enterobacter asburiae]
MPWEDVALWVVDITPEAQWERFLQLARAPEDCYLLVLCRSSHPAVARRLAGLTQCYRAVSLPEEVEYLPHALTGLLSAMGAGECPFRSEPFPAPARGEPEADNPESSGSPWCKAPLSPCARRRRRRRRPFCRGI